MRSSSRGLEAACPPACASAGWFNAVDDIINSVVVVVVVVATLTAACGP